MEGGLFLPLFIPVAVAEGSYYAPTRSPPVLPEGHVQCERKLPASPWPNPLPSLARPGSVKDTRQNADHNGRRGWAGLAWREAGWGRRQPGSPAPEPLGKPFAQHREKAKGRPLHSPAHSMPIPDYAWKSAQLTPKGGGGVCSPVASVASSLPPSFLPPSLPRQAQSGVGNSPDPRGLIRTASAAPLIQGGREHPPIPLECPFVRIGPGLWSAG